MKDNKKMKRGEGWKKSESILFSAKVLGISLMLFIFFNISSFAQQNLQQLINYALKHSNDVKKASLQQEEAFYQHREAARKGLPQIEGKGSYSKMGLGDLSSSLNGFVPSDQSEMVSQMLSGWDNLYMASVTAQVTQLIYSQSYWSGLKLTRKTKELYDIMKEQSDEDIIAEVANNYYQAGSLMMQLQSLNKSKENLEEMYKVVELSYENDMTTETEVNRIKVSVVNLTTSIRSVENTIEIQKDYIKALAGLPHDTVITIDTAYISTVFKLRPQNTFNIEDVSSYQLMMKQDEIYKGKVKTAQAEYYPTLAAYAQLGYSYYGVDMKPSDLGNMNTIGLNLTIPIFTAGSRHSKVKQYQLQRAQLQEDIEKNTRFLTIDYTSAVMEYNTAAELLNVQKENRDLAQKVYDQTLLQYKEGMASIADVLNVNSDYLQADNSYNQQIIKCKTAEVKMLKASGQIKQMAEQ